MASDQTSQEDPQYTRAEMREACRINYNAALLTTTDLLRRTEAALDAILRGNHAGWDQALAALRKELREALGAQ